MKRKLSIIGLCLLSLTAHAQYTHAQYKEDFSFFWTSINDDYAYFSKKQCDWARVKDIYMPMVDTVTVRASFVSILEQAFYEIYDHHASLNTNNLTSQHLVPSGADIWAVYENGKAVIMQVRKGFGAERVGVRAGMEIVAINDVPVQQAIVPFTGRSLKSQDNAALTYALCTALAGNHIQPRKLTLKNNGATKDYFPDANGMQLEHIQYSSMVEGKKIGDIGYVKLNNCLGDNDMIPMLDSVMKTMQGTKALILDLRETPSGGNTTVARAILGWFTSKEQFYQKHELYAEEKQTGIKRSWEEIVSPRAGKYYSKPMVVLADHWTGSIAEGITVAFDGMKRATIIGTTMARLNGANYTYTMPNTKINFSFPVERLYHINGTPRELYKPNIIIDYPHLPATLNNDPALDNALQVLKK